MGFGIYFNSIINFDDIYNLLTILLSIPMEFVIYLRSNMNYAWIL